MEPACFQKQLAEVLISRFEKRPQLQGGLEGICRLLLIADLYNVALLRDHCLYRLAGRFDSLATGSSPQHEAVLFGQFLNAVTPVVSSKMPEYNACSAV